LKGGGFPAYGGTFGISGVNGLALIPFYPGVTGVGTINLSSYKNFHTLKSF